MAKVPELVHCLSGVGPPLAFQPCRLSTAAPPPSPHASGAPPRPAHANEREVSFRGQCAPGQWFAVVLSAPPEGLRRSAVPGALDPAGHLAPRDGGGGGGGGNGRGLGSRGGCVGFAGPEQWARPAQSSEAAAWPPGRAVREARPLCCPAPLRDAGAQRPGEQLPAREAATPWGGQAPSTPAQRDPPSPGPSTGPAPTGPWAFPIIVLALASPPHSPPSPRNCDAGIQLLSIF